MPGLSLTIAFMLFTVPLLAEAQQVKFWTMELGNSWEYVEGPVDTWTQRNQVAVDTATFAFTKPSFLRLFTCSSILKGGTI